LSRLQKGAAITTGLLILLFPLIRPLMHTLGRSDKEVHVEAMEVVEWLSTEAGPDAVIMDFPIIEKYVYLYDLPTVNTPFGSISDIWKVARDYHATHFVVCRDQLELIPSLTAYWRSETDRPIERRLPAFLSPVLTTQAGMFRLYRFSWENEASISNDVSQSD
jgi:hypothetical protein